MRIKYHDGILEKDLTCIMPGFLQYFLSLVFGIYYMLSVVNSSTKWTTKIRINLCTSYLKREITN